eukprot:3672881-Rhodomonas_salina.1
MMSVQSWYPAPFADSASLSLSTVTLVGQASSSWHSAFFLASKLALLISVTGWRENNGRYVVSAGEDGCVRVFDLRRGQESCYCEVGRELTCLAKTDDDSILAAGDRLGGLHLFTLQDAGSGSGFSLRPKSRFKSSKLKVVPGPATVPVQVPASVQVPAVT